MLSLPLLVNTMPDNSFAHNELTERVLAEGAYRAAVIPVSKIKLDPVFRGMCESNVCGNYGKCWMCPPDVGNIDLLIGEIKKFDYALVYQTVCDLEDSYDFEGMMEAGEKHNRLTQRIVDMITPESVFRVLHLGAGGCRLCPVCAKKENRPCRHPDIALSSLEAYGINVSELAEACGMKYINGQNTVTYFGAAFFVL